MSILSDFDVDKVCRVCLTRSENMKSLFAVSSSAVVLSFAELLSKFTPIQCATNDGLPNQLCNNCTNQLTQFNTFHAKCVETNQALQAYVEKRRKTDVNVFAAVDIKTEFDPVEAIYIEETDHQNDVYTNFNSLKNPLDISDLQVDLEQDLDVIKHEIDENTTAKISLTSKNTPQTTITTINTGLDTLELIAKPYACETRIANPGFEEVLIKTDAEESIFMGNQGHLDISVLKIGPKRNTSLMIHEIGEIQAKLPENATDNASNVEEAIEKPYACTLCTSAFKAMKNLNVHMKKHRGGKPYSCPTCSRTFNRKSYFAVHLRTHTGERPYACAMCESSFNEKSALTVHTRMHTNERPFPCTVCDSSFKQKATLTAHMRKHNGEKPYACYICKLAFRQDAHLKTHMRTHTGERPYWCPVCKRAFKQKISLTRHVRVHTGEKPYACTYCKSVFNQRRKLAKHLRTHADTPLG